MKFKKREPKEKPNLTHLAEKKVKVFAWLPVKLKNGVIVWLEYYFKIYVYYDFNQVCPQFVNKAPYWIHQHTTHQ